jgi:hypothetical protein
MTISESALLDAIRLYAGWPYTRAADDLDHDGKPDEPTYPEPIASALGLPSARVTKRTNCCAFAEGIVLAALGAERARTCWTWGIHRSWMIQGKDRFGPVSAAIAMELGDPAVDVRALTIPPLRWFICQGWRPDGGGHTFLGLRYERRTDKIQTLEANIGLGVGHRGVGPFDPAAIVEPAGWRRGSWTWTKIRQTYSAGLRLTALRVA